MTRQKNKTDTIGVRVSPKTRYALDLIARKHGASLSALMVSAAEKLIEAEGMTVVRPGDDSSLIDKLWSESEGERLLALKQHAPSLLTYPEGVMADVLYHINYLRKMEKYENDAGDRGQRLVITLCHTGLDDLLLSPGINDTFADDLLKVGGEFENTIALKKAVKDLNDQLEQGKAEITI